MDPIFLSANGDGVVLVCTDASGSTRVALVGDGDSLVVTNTGGAFAYLALGGANDSFTALAPGDSIVSGDRVSYPVVPNSKEDQIIIAKGLSYHGAPYVAGVCKAGETTTLIVHLVQR